MDVSPARRTFAQEKEALEHDVIEMIARAEAMFDKAVVALKTLDRKLAHEAMSLDDAIDRQDLEIEERCLRLLALQQPMAGDLREIGTVIKMITDIERIGDLSVDIAKIALKIEKELGHADYVDIPKMAAFARSMLNEVVQAFARRDTSRFAFIAELEDQVDNLYRDLRDQIHNYMRSKPEEVVAASWLLLALHHIERVADHAVNMTERIGFMVTGELRQLVLDPDENGSSSDESEPTDV